MRKKALKLIGFVCALALIVTVLYVPFTVSATNEEVTSVRLRTGRFLTGALDASGIYADGFESGEPTYGYINTTGAFSVSDEEKYAGEKSLKIDPTATSMSGMSGIYLINSIEKNTEYVISFKLKIASTSDQVVKFTPLFRQNANLSKNLAPQASADITINAGFHTDGWEDVSLYVKTKNTNSYTSSAYGIFLNIASTAAKGATTEGVFYIDDITVQKVGSGQKAVKLDGSGTDLLVTYAVGTVGQPLGITLPAPFIGWCSDKGLTTSLTEVTSSTTNAYAKWAAAPQSFKNYPYSTTVSYTFSKKASIVHEDGYGEDDDYAVNFHIDHSAVYNIKKVCSSCGQQSDEDATVCTKNVKVDGVEQPCNTPFTGDEKTVTYYQSSRYNARDYILKLKENVKTADYVVTYSYRVNTLGVDTVITFVTGHKDNIWGSNYFESKSSYKTIKTSEAGTGWHQVKVLYQAVIGGSGSYANCAFMQINPVAATPDAIIDIDIDNVLIEEVPEDTKYVSVIAGNAYTEPVTSYTYFGSAGDAIDVSTTDFSKGKASLRYLSSDAEGTNEVAAPTAIGTESVTLYANWGPDPISFDKYSFDLTDSASNYYFTRKGKIVNEAGYGQDDDYALNLHIDHTEIYKTYRVCPVCKTNNELDAATCQKKDANGNLTCNYEFTGSESLYYSYQSIRYTGRDYCFALKKISKIDGDGDYKITYSYRVNKLNLDTVVHFATAWERNVWGSTYAEDMNSAVTLKKDDVGKGWQQATVLYTAKTSNTGGGADCIFLMVNPAANTTDGLIDIDFDDIYIEKLSDTDSYVLFSANADNVTNIGITQSPTNYVLFGKAGDPVDASAVAVSRGRSPFKYWSSDTDGANKVSIPSVIGTEGKTIYANWGPDPICFDKYSYDLTDPSSYLYFSRKMSFETDGYDDNISLHAKYNGSNINGYTKTCASCKKATSEYEATVCPNCGAAFTGTETLTPKYDDERSQGFDNIAVLQLCKTDTAYKITYKYKVIDANIDVYCSFTSCWAKNIWAGAKVYNSSARLLKASDKGAGWKEMTTYVYTHYDTDTYAGNNTAFFVQFNAATDKRTGYYEVAIDNISIEEVTEGPCVIFEPGQTFMNEHCEGAVSLTSTINYPDIKKFGYEFDGWYADAEFTTPYNATVAPSTPVRIFGKWVPAKTRVYDFEDATYRGTDRTAGYFCDSCDAEVVTTSKAHSGNHVLQFDRTAEYITNLGGAGALMINGTKTCSIKRDINYLVSVWICYAQAPSNQTILRFSVSASNNMYGGVRASQEKRIRTDVEVGKWIKYDFYLSGAVITPEKSYVNSACLSLSAGNDAIIYVDDFTITELPEGTSVIYCNTNGATSIPELVTAKVGTSFKPLFPSSPKKENCQFMGYAETKQDAEGNYIYIEDYTTTLIPREMQAHWLKLRVLQGFEDSFITRYKAFKAMSIMDFDYEIYDGIENDVSNITEGRRSLHRMGKSMYKENVSLLGLDDVIEANRRYTVTFDIKMDKSFHTDGAVKIASSMSGTFPYNTMGDYYPVIAIKDLTDGEWHTVSYTFNSLQPFLALQTPGYCSIYIDNVVIDLVDENTPLSLPIQFTEYVPALRDENGNLVEKNTYGFVDVDSIIDSSLYGFNMPAWLIAVIGVVLVGAGVGAFFFIRSKKKKAATATDVNV